MFVGCLFDFISTHFSIHLSIFNDQDCEEQGLFAQLSYLSAKFEQMPLNLFMNQINNDFDGPCAINFQPYIIPELAPKNQDT